eukprot:5594893-Prymnesium_polylepis.3
MCVVPAKYSIHLLNDESTSVLRSSPPSSRCVSLRTSSRRCISNAATSRAAQMRAGRSGARDAFPLTPFWRRDGVPLCSRLWRLLAACGVRLPSQDLSEAPNSQLPRTGRDL